MLLKLDLEKTFDHLEWSFVRKILLYFNIHNSLTNLIMSCITTTTTSILINGTRTSYFSPSRGIRQGDPLSPYIFIMCIEIRFHMINQSVDYLNWHPIRISKHGLHMSHLFFDNDIMLLSKVNLQSYHAIIDVLNHFNQICGKKINFLKSKIFFSKHCSATNKNFVLQSFSMKEG